MICRFMYYQKIAEGYPASYVFSAVYPIDGAASASENEALFLKESDDGQSFALGDSSDSHILTTYSQRELSISQLIAVNSGITVGKISTYDGYAAKITTAQTTADNAASAAATAQSTADSKQDALSVESPITLSGSTLGFGAAIAPGTAPTELGGSTLGQTAVVANWAKSVTIGDDTAPANVASGIGAWAEGQSTTASGFCSHAEGCETTASEECSHAEGSETTASGFCSHAEGSGTTASGDDSHAEGDSGTTASATGSHAEGGGTRASNVYSHAEGSGTTASGFCSHAEGGDAHACGNRSHAEGYFTYADGYAKHACGMYNERETTDWAASTAYAVGDRVIATDDSGATTIYICKTAHTSGSSFSSANWQREDATHRGKYAFVIGNGTSGTARSNAVAVDWEGNSYQQGDVTCDATQGNHENLYSLRAIGAIVASTPSFEHGTSNSVTVSANSHTVVDITFGSAKTEIPVVFPAIQCPTAGVNLIATVQSVSNSQCAICVTNLGTTDVSDVTVDYLAVYGR